MDSGQSRLRWGGGKGSNARNGVCRNVPTGNRRTVGGTFRRPFPVLNPVSCILHPAHTGRYPAPVTAGCATAGNGGQGDTTSAERGDFSTNRRAAHASSPPVRVAFPVHAAHAGVLGTSGCILRGSPGQLPWSTNLPPVIQSANRNISKLLPQSSPRRSTAPHP